MKKAQPVMRGMSGRRGVRTVCRDCSNSQPHEYTKGCIRCGAQNLVEYVRDVESNPVFLRMDERWFDPVGIETLDSVGNLTTDIEPMVAPTADPERRLTSWVEVKERLLWHRGGGQ